MKFKEITGLTLFGLDFLYYESKEMFYIIEYNYFPSFKEYEIDREDFMNQHLLNMLKSK